MVPETLLSPMSSFVVSAVAWRRESWEKCRLKRSTEVMSNSEDSYILLSGLAMLVDPIAKVLHKNEPFILREGGHFSLKRRRASGEDIVLVQGSGFSVDLKLPVVLCGPVVLRDERESTMVQQSPARVFQLPQAPTRK